MPEIPRQIIRRILARAENPEASAAEIEWIKSEERLLGKSFGAGVRSIEAEIAAGAMIVVSEENDNP